MVFMIFSYVLSVLAFFCKFPKSFFFFFFCGFVVEIPRMPIMIPNSVVPYI